MSVPDTNTDPEGLDPEAGLDPEDQVQLAALIETLRAAAPTREELAPVRAEIVRGESAPAPQPVVRWSAWQAAAVLAITFALGVLARDAWVGSRSEGSAGDRIATSEPLELPRAEPPVIAPAEPALALVPPPPIEVLADDGMRSPVVRFVETAGSFPAVDESEVEEEAPRPGDEVLDCRLP